MEYKVSEKVQKKFDTLTKDAKVQKAVTVHGRGPGYRDRQTDRADTDPGSDKP